MVKFVATLVLAIEMKSQVFKYTAYLKLIHSNIELKCARNCSTPYRIRMKISLQNSVTNHVWLSQISTC